jgi:hypothetical protein
MRRGLSHGNFGVSSNAPIPGTANGMLLSDKVTIAVDVEAVLQGG